MATEAHLLDLQRQNKLLNRLLEVSLVLNSSLAIQPLLDFILDATCEITGCEAASIILHDRNADELRFVASNTPGTHASELVNIGVPMEHSVAGQIFRENHAVVIADDDDPRIYRPVDEAISFRTRSLLGVPMQIKDEVIGVLEAVNKRKGKWVQEDLPHLMILAAQAAVAIHNAQQAEQLQKAYDDLHQLDKLKNDFIAIASHELRTPLGVILGYASFLQEEAEGEASEHAAAVLNSAIHLRSLIEDMTNLRFLQLGKTELSCETVLVSALLTAAEHDVQSLIQAKNHRLVVDKMGSDCSVYVDRIKVGMALTNALNNAIKFTPSGGQITLSADKRSHEVWIRVSDTGLGIPEDQLEKVFDQFYQVADHMTRQHNGMGIGLSIARGLIQAQGGRMWAESAGVNMGATFIIALPLSDVTR